MIATTRGALLRGTTTENDLGDEITTDDVAEVFSEWAETRRNLHPSPSPKSGTPPVGWFNSGNFGVPTGGALGVFHTRGTPGAFTTGVQLGGGGTGNTLLAAVNPGAKYAGSIEIETDFAGMVLAAVLVFRNAAGTYISDGPVGAATTLAANDPVSLSTGVATAPGSAAFAVVRFVAAGASSFPAGGVLYARRQTVERADAVSPYAFDGDAIAQDLTRTRWLGAPSASPSVIETRKALPSAPVRDFPLSLIERDAQEFDQASNQWRTVRKLIGRVPSNVPVDEGDRIKDLRDGAIYAVDGFRRTPRGLSGRSSVTLNLRRTAP